MTLIQAIHTALLTIVIFSSIGILIRCIQERFHPILWLLSVILFFIMAIVLLIVPLVLFLKYLFKPDKGMSFKRRIYSILLSIPVGYVWVVVMFRNSIETTLWTQMAKLNESFVSTEHKDNVKSSSTIISGSMFNTLDALERKLGLLRVHI